MNNALLVVSNCDDGLVTHPKLEHFTDEVSADNWSHIGVPRMSDDDFESIVSQIQLLIQRYCDDKRKSNFMDEHGLGVDDMIDDRVSPVGW